MANVGSFSPSIQSQPIKPQQNVAPQAPTVPQTPSTSVQAPAKTGPSSGLQAHNQTIATQQQLTSPVLPEQVGKLASGSSPEKLQETASHIQDLGQGLMKTVSPSGSSSGSSVASTVPIAPEAPPLSSIPDAPPLVSSEPKEKAAPKPAKADTPKADTPARSSLGQAPTRSEMLHNKGLKEGKVNILEKLYRQATPALPQEVTQLQDKKAALTKDIARLQAVLPADASTAPQPDIEAIRTKVEKVAAPIRKEIADFKASLATMKDSPAKTFLIKTRLGELESKLEGAMKPLHKANMMVSLKEKSAELAQVDKDITKKQGSLETAAKATGLENQRQDLKAAIASASDSDKPALKEKLATVEHELHGLEKEMGHGGMEWGRVKKEYLGSDRREFTMKAVIDYRQQFVLNTFKEVCADLKKAEVGGLQKELTALESAQPRNNDAINAKKEEITKVTASWDNIDKRAVGSTDLTSDFDMTVLADRPGMDTKVMKEVNARFQQHFGKEAGSVFDTNLYVEGGGPAIKKEVKNGAKQWATPEARAAHDEGQDTAALVKQRLYSTQDNWDGFVDKVRTGLKENLKAVTPALSDSEINTRVEAQISRYTAADKLFKERGGKIEAGIEALKALPENRGRSHYELEISAMNRLYETESAKADGIKADWEALKKASPPNPAAIDAKWAEYTAADAKAQLYANEPYFSEGPVRHVVGNEQALKGLQLTGTGDAARYQLKAQTDDKGVVQELKIDTAQALESLTENFGDSKKELNHLKHEGKGMGDIAIKASKYMGRLTRAIDLAIPKDQQSEGMRTTIDKLQAAEVELLRIRKGGQLPADFKGSTEEYAIQVLKDKGLGNLLEVTPPQQPVDKLQDCFESLAMEASIQIRTGMAKPVVTPAPVVPPTPQTVPDVAKPIQ